MAANHIPPGFQAITPSLALRDAASAIEFYSRAFGATEALRLTSLDGTIAHAELDIAGGRIMVAEEDPEFNAAPETLGGTTIILHLYVPDVDAFVARAVEAGCEIVTPVADQFYGDRAGRIVDPFGYLWIVATRKETISEEEMQRRLDAQMKR